MKSLKDVKKNEMKWIQSGKLESQLVTIENETIAKLVWKNSWGSLATGESSEGRWTLKREGFLRPRITIREAGSDFSLGVLSMRSVGSGVLRFEDGQTYQFNRSKEGLKVVNPSGDNVLVLKPVLMRTRKEASVQIRRKIRYRDCIDISNPCLVRYSAHFRLRRRCEFHWRLDRNNGIFCLTRTDFSRPI